MKYCTATDILNMQKKKQEKRFEAFDKITEQCYKKIEKCVEITRNIFSCLFEVPEFMIGYPLYDLNECLQYVMRILISKGFVVNYSFPRLLLVSWLPPSNTLLPMPDNMTVKKTVKVKPKKATTVKVQKNTGKFILDLS
jgi:hypothetical protein